MHLFIVAVGSSARPVLRIFSVDGYVYAVQSSAKQHVKGKMYCMGCNSVTHLKSCEFLPGLNQASQRCLGMLTARKLAETLSAASTVWCQYRMI